MDGCQRYAGGRQHLLKAGAQSRLEDRRNVRPVIGRKLFRLAGIRRQGVRMLAQRHDLQHAGAARERVMALEAGSIQNAIFILPPAPLRRAASATLIRARRPAQPFRGEGC